MSVGVCGGARIIDEDEHWVIYEYWASNLNDSAYYNAEHIHDGLIMIQKTVLVEPEVREKLKHLPSGRKKTVVKRIRNDVKYNALLTEGNIIVKNSNFCWRLLGNGVGMIAMQVIFQIFDLYQDHGKLPLKVSYYL